MQWIPVFAVAKRYGQVVRLARSFFHIQKDWLSFAYLNYRNWPCDTFVT